MESTKQNKKRNLREEDLDATPDVEMEESTGVDTQQKRKIIKIKKRNPEIPEEEEGIVYSEDEFEEEIIVERENDEYDEEVDEEWEDVDSPKEQQMKDETIKQQAKPKTNKKEIWDETKEPLKENEELVFDNSAYQMLHRAKVEWPCLSIDIILKDRLRFENDYQSWFPSYTHTLDPKATLKDKHGLLRHKTDKFPYTVYFCAGSQSLKKNENKIYAMKWSDMRKTLRDDDEVNEEDSQEEEDQEEVKDPEMRFECVPHKGCVNRIRSLHGTGIVATWNDESEVAIYNITQAIESLDLPQDKKKKKTFGGSKLASFKHTDEGYALDWSSLTWGRLAAGSCNAQIYLYQASDAACSTFVKETQVGLQGHKKSVEDVQFSPSQEHVLASCSVDQTVKLWDLRATQMKAQMSFLSHDCDVNVISWNQTTKFLLASGDDKGEFRIWDLRMLKPVNSEFESITRIRWHTQAITSLQFQPGEESVLAVCSADNKLTLWDFSVEVDETQQTVDDDVPPQLMFLHQGQTNMKELRFHPYYHEMLVTTAEDSYNIFRPNLEPDEQQLEQPEDEEEKSSDTRISSNKQANYYVGSDEEEDEEERMVKAAKKINKQRNQKEKKSKEGKRRKMQ